MCVIADCPSSVEPGDGDGDAPRMPRRVRIAGLGADARTEAPVLRAAGAVEAVGVGPAAACPRPRAGEGAPLAASVALNLDALATGGEVAAADLAAEAHGVAVNDAVAAHVDAAGCADAHRHGPRQ